jgi:hypothetical protein
MGNPVGAEISFAIGDEDSYAGGQASADLVKVHLGGAPGLVSTQELEANEGLSLYDEEPLPGLHDAAGALPVKCCAESVGKLLKHLFGAPSTSGTDPYVHTYTIGTVPAYSLIGERDNGSNAPTGGRYELFSGLRVAGMTLEAGGKTKPAISFDLRGAGNSAHSDDAHDATITDLGCTPFSVHEFSAKEGGSANTRITALSIKASRELDEDGYAAGGSGARTQMLGGPVKVEGEGTFFFDSMAEMTKAINNTESSIEAILSRGDGDGSSGNESISFAVGALKYKRSSPPVEGPLGVRVKLSFTGYGSSALTVTLKNAVSAP